MASNNHIQLGNTPPLFYAVFDRIVPAVNKYMATLFNTGLNLLMVNRIYRVNWQNTDVSDSNLEQYLARITARTVGTSVIIGSDDTGDSTPSGAVADTGSTVVTETNIRLRFFSTNDSSVGLTGGDKFGTAIVHSFNIQDGIIYRNEPGVKGMVLRQNQGISIRNVTSNTIGTVSYVFEFTQVYP